MPKYTILVKAFRVHKDISKFMRAMDVGIDTVGWDIAEEWTFEVPEENKEKAIAAFRTAYQGTGHQKVEIYELKEETKGRDDFQAPINRITIP